MTGMEYEDWRDRERERKNEERLIEQKRKADEAIERAYKNALTDWQNTALATVEKLAYERDSFTADDVWDAGLGQPPNDPRALGGVFRRSVNAGLIEDSGRVVRSHRRHYTKMTVWASKLRSPVYV